MPCPAAAHSPADASPSSEPHVRRRRQQQNRKQHSAHAPRAARRARGNNVVSADAGLRIASGVLERDASAAGTELAGHVQGGVVDRHLPCPPERRTRNAP